MKKMSYYFISAIIIGLGFGCQDNNENDTVPAVEIIFELLNKDMEPADTFDAGEDIFCKLSIENLSNKDLALYYIYTDDKNWLKLKKWSRLSDSSQTEGWVDLNPPIKFFENPYIFGHPIPAKSNFLFVLSLLGNQQSTIAPDGWRVEYNHNQFDKGDYAAEINSFQAVFSDSYTTPEKSFRKEFRIK